LKAYPPDRRPNSTIVFWTFRLMVGLGLLMILLGVWSGLARWRGTLYTSKPLLRFALAMGPTGVLAILAGWMTTEIGRQPWVVYGVMRTADAASVHGVPELIVTLALFVVIYLLVFGAGLVYLLRLIALGPAAPDAAAPMEGGAGRPRQPMRPISAAGPAAIGG
jgi:cytochrome d ubiquinol oxidase subunit I